MRVKLWGTRGSLAASGPDTVAYGGDTSAVELRIDDDTALVLDAGSGIRRLSDELAHCRRIDVLLTHLHMDHIQGLGFFAPLLDPDVEVHLWGPASPRFTLEHRLSRYLSPPLFPVRLRDTDNVYVHDLDPGTVELGGATVQADFVVHPGLTYGYRITADGGTVAYVPDHEPALGAVDFPGDPEWVSGFDLVNGADLLIHDAQYTEEEYETRRGWGHSTFRHAAALATLAGASRLVSFHHDPAHDDAMLDAVAAAIEEWDVPFEFVPGKAGIGFDL
ncbi:MAG TPA: MBL fold metallo-hydrolase [Acidimicrobiia bacterium]|nr:MBL fold metallo-hydrolase [Acidimicrobiia bacterium]